MHIQRDIKAVMQKATVRATEKEKFRMEALFRDLIALDRYYQSTHEEIVGALGQAAGEHAIKGMLREAFYIQMVHARGGAAQYSVRWEVNDIRRAEYEVCFEIFRKLRVDLQNYITVPGARELMLLMPNHAQLPYEVPIDYIQRKTDEPIHTPENIHWFNGAIPTRAIKLRQALLGDRRSNAFKFFQGVYKKIKTKVYLTDRAQTGFYKTNREQRWEVHPLSVQFSLRENCMEIEHKLINQICYFDGAPRQICSALEQAGLIEKLDAPIVCPITLDPLSFNEFENEILHPQHGRAKFQVGHMNPLKAEGEEEGEEEDAALALESNEVEEIQPAAVEPSSHAPEPHAVKIEDIGHIASNTSWVTADGNRIQGHLTLDDVRTLLTRIANNYTTKKHLN